MRVSARLLLAACLASPASAQPPVDVAGRWEGTVQMPDRELRVTFDLGPDPQGKLVGTFAEPDSGVKGFPLSSVSVTGRKVELLLKAGPQPSTFAGEISADGKTLAGDASQGGQSAPFSLTRTGPPQFAKTPRNAAVGQELEGTWNGTLELGDRKMRLVLKIANQHDGAVGTVMSPDGSGVEIAVALEQKGAALKVEAASVGASYAGTLDAATGQLSGNWTQAGATLPLTFRRAGK